MTWQGVLELLSPLAFCSVKCLTLADISHSTVNGEDKCQPAVPKRMLISLAVILLGIIAVLTHYLPECVSLTSFLSPSRGDPHHAMSMPVGWSLRDPCDAPRHQSYDFLARN